MTRNAPAPTLALAALALLVLGVHSDVDPRRPVGPLAVCFAPDTPASYVESVECALQESGLALFQASDNRRWFGTSRDGAFLRQGEPTTLTWSVVPDGTSVLGAVGEGTSPSNLRAFLDGIYGSESTWRPILSSVFERWGELSGVTYLYEAQDDGASLGTRSGAEGVRGDIRLSGHAIDGRSGTLAYNFFPDNGDMVIDTSDSFFTDTRNGSLRLRNVIAHEHGHGLGIDHVCPTNSTKLMEPFSGTVFDGPQHDDIRAVQRLYGDPLEPNDSSGAAVDLGTLSPGNHRIGGVGLAGTADADWLSFRVGVPARVDVRLRPVGERYSEGPQLGGTCSSGATLDSTAIQDLVLQLRDGGTTVLATSDASSRGGEELIQEIPTPTSRRNVVRVTGRGTDDTQLYRLDITVTASASSPIAATDTVETLEDEPVVIDALGNDAGLADTPLVVKVESDPANGDARLLDDGTFRYTPSPNFAGEDSFTYRVKDADGQAASGVVTVTVTESPRAGLARADTDGDAYPDELEEALQTATDDADSRPADAVPGPLGRTSGRIKLRFRKDAADTLRLKGRLILPPEFVAEGQVVTCYAGGLVTTFVLDAKGKGRTHDGARLELKVRPGGVETRFRLRLPRAAYAAELADERLTGEENVRRSYRELTTYLLVGGGASAATLPLRYTARRGRSGSAKVLSEAP